MFRKMIKTQVRIANKDFHLQLYFGEARDVVIIWKSCLIFSFFPDCVDIAIEFI